ncbi:sugar transporter ERD6-like 15 isoform X4 [Gossypium australe]|uniref:Sugar transporter ERD6-like 15 isoform X4 n=1 Tax=Gossypium australe TaxID=47621 RepID=A0A5B6VUE9_9ROSI|nr:sugar transporter ERD6-like 15 isoform X4 [Gossypium australe]
MDYRFDLKQASIYVAEITTKNVRGRFTIIVQFLTGWGVSFMFVVGSFVHWRTLALLATIPALLQLLLLFFIPESPQWLMSTIRVSLKFYSYGSVPILKAQAKFGREKELEAALLCLRGDKADISHEATEIKDYVESLKSFSSEGILDIFQKKYVRPLLTVAGALVLMNLGGINALTYYSGAIFVSAGVSSMVGLITLAATQTVIGILGATLIDKLGRRPLLLVSSAGLRFSSFLTGVSFFLMDSDISPSSLHVARFVSSPSCMLTSKMYMGSYALGGVLPLLLLSELFPINVKGSAGSMCNFMGNFTGWVVAYYFNFLIEWSSTGIFFIFSAFSFANFILTATMVPETKGRTLEEIRASITHSSD